MQNTHEQSSNSGSLAMYLSEINQYALLSVDEEQALARKFIKGDLSAGHHLVTSQPALRREGGLRVPLLRHQDE